MSRILPHPVLFVVLTLVWLMLTRFSLGHLVLGAAVALVASQGMAALMPARPRFRRWDLIPRLCAIVAWDIAADKKTEVFRDDNTDPTPIYVEDKLYGVRLMDGLPRTHFFDPQSAVAKLYRKLEKAFAGQRVDITSMTADGKTALVLVGGDRNPGDFFIFDSTNNKADRLLGRKEWLLDSTDRRNSLSISLCRCFVAKRLAWPFVELARHGI